MSFLEERLSERISFGARGGPAFSTQVAKSFSGFRSANQNWVMPLHRYDISQCVRSNDDFEEMRAFFYNVKGQLDGFRFKDWGDYLATIANTTLVASGGDWQLMRVYRKGVRTFSRPIYKPVDGTVVVYDGANAPLPAVVDATTGLATVTGTPASWSGEFDVPVAFTNDLMEVEITSRNESQGLLMSWPSVQLEEIREKP